MHDENNLTLLIDEYRSFIHETTGGERGLDWSALTDRLISDGEWSADGAHHVAELVQAYGSFVLRNAAALAIAAEVEDGEIGL